MDPLNPSDVIDLLRSPTLRTRVAIWLAPPEKLGSEKVEAIRLGVEAVDLRDELLAFLEPGTRFVHIDEERLTRLLDGIASRAGNGCALVYNLDLLLAAMNVDRCVVWWSTMADGLPYRSRALLLMMPQTASNLLPPPRILLEWREQQRLAGLLPIP